MWSHAGSRLLADVVDRTALTGQLAEALAGLRRAAGSARSGRVLIDMAVAVADGVTTISDVAVVAGKAELSVRWRRTRRSGGCSTS